MTKIDTYKLYLSSFKPGCNSVTTDSWIRHLISRASDDKMLYALLKKIVCVRVEAHVHPHHAYKDPSECLNVDYHIFFTFPKEAEIFDELIDEFFRYQNIKDFIKSDHSFYINTEFTKDEE